MMIESAPNKELWEKCREERVSMEGGQDQDQQKDTRAEGTEDRKVQVSSKLLQ